jgi:hypothetical protein
MISSTTPALREAALRPSYPPQAGMFPGRNLVERIDIDGLTQQCSRLVGEPLQAMPPPRDARQEPHHAGCGPGQGQGPCRWRALVWNSLPAAGENFGDSLENGRLVYLMFFASAQQ